MQTSFSRREFVAGCLASAGVAAALGPPGGHCPLRLALCDTRYPSAVPFSRAMARRGVALAPFFGDVTTVWYEQLDPLWRRDLIRVAGLTDEATLFCLEQMAWDHGLRVAIRGTHDPAPLGGVIHLFEAAPQRRRDLMHGLWQQRDWAAQVADHLASMSDPVPAFPSTAQARSQSRLRTAAGPYDSGTRVVSWLIAPKKGAYSLRSV